MALKASVGVTRDTSTSLLLCYLQGKDRPLAVSVSSGRKFSSYGAGMAAALQEPACCLKWLADEDRSARTRWPNNPSDCC
jgi:hypothetical protein